MKSILVASTAAVLLMVASPVSADGGMMSVTPSTAPAAEVSTQLAAIASYSELVNQIVIGVLELFDWKNDDGQIAFTDANYSAQYDCNTLSGGYAVNLMDVDFSEPAMTEMACAEDAMDADQQLAEDLGDVTTLTFQDGKLVMTGGDTTLSFTASLPEAE